jgi:hypothetical protein
MNPADCSCEPKTLLGSPSLTHARARSRRVRSPKFIKVSVGPFEEQIEFITMSERQQKLDEVLFFLNSRAGLLECRKFFFISLVILCFYSLQSEYRIDSRLQN